MTRTIRTLAATATATVALAAALVGLGAGTPAQAADFFSDPTLNCYSDSIQAPGYADPVQLNIYAYQTLGSGWNYAYRLSSGITTWRWANGQWSRTDASSSSLQVGQRITVAWTYTFLLVEGQWQARGWTYLGSC